MKLNSYPVLLVSCCLLIAGCQPGDQEAVEMEFDELLTHVKRELPAALHEFKEGALLEGEVTHEFKKSASSISPYKAKVIFDFNAPEVVQSEPCLIHQHVVVQYEYINSSWVCSTITQKITDLEAPHLMNDIRDEIVGGVYEAYGAKIDEADNTLFAFFRTAR